MIRFLQVCLAGAALFTAGCARDELAIREEGRLTISARPPGFMTGAAAALFTDLPSFRARAVIRHPGVERAAEGELVGRDGALLFLPEDTGRKRSAGMVYSFDANKNSGFVISEVMQGYATFVDPPPQTLDVNPTATGVAIDTIDGHPCQVSEVSYALGDGTSGDLEVWRARDLNGFPLRIRKISGSGQYDVQLHDVQFEPVAGDTFIVPEGLTRFESPDRLLDELLLRYVSRRRDDGRQYEEVQQPPPFGSRRY